MPRLEHPDDGFGHENYQDDVQYALAHLWNETRSDNTCKEWGEINEMKYLFAGQAWTRAQVNTFLDAAWNYIGSNKMARYVKAIIYTAVAIWAVVLLVSGQSFLPTCFAPVHRHQLSCAAEHRI